VMQQGGRNDIDVVPVGDTLVSGGSFKVSLRMVLIGLLELRWNGFAHLVGVTS
jgi:hypothetical protein